MILEASDVWDSFGVQKGDSAELVPVKVLITLCQQRGSSCGWCEIPVAQQAFGNHGKQSSASLSAQNISLQTLLELGLVSCGLRKLKHSCTLRCSGPAGSSWALGVWVAAQRKPFLTSEISSLPHSLLSPAVTNTSLMKLQ